MYDCISLAGEINSDFFGMCGMTANVTALRRWGFMCSSMFLCWICCLALHNCSLCFHLPHLRKTGCSSNTFGEFSILTVIPPSPFIKNISKMKGNEISVKELRSDAVEWLTKLHQTMVIKEYGKGSVRNYCQEMRLLFKY